VATRCDRRWCRNPFCDGDASARQRGRGVLFALRSQAIQVHHTEAEQARCPKWDPGTEPNPPYPAAKALEQGRQFIATVPTKSDTFWEFEDLSLVKVSGSWAWRARYRLTLRGGSTGVWPTMDCWILMDGTRIQPKITSERAK
jgi:hypothetical protein